MHRAKSVIAVLLSGTLALPVFAQTRSFTLNEGHGVIDAVTGNYRPHGVAQVSFDDSPRLEKLMRAGVIYLSLRDAIALALENNLDIESARYYPKLALSDLQRASAGQLLRNVSTNLSQGPSSASLSVLAGASQVNAAGASQLQRRHRRRAQRPERPVGRLRHSQHRTVLLRRRRLLPHHQYRDLHAVHRHAVPGAAV